MSEKYTWMKLKADFFDKKIIKKIRMIACGDTYTIIYLKMQLLSIKTEGVIYYEGIEDSFSKELALELDEDVENVEMLLSFLNKHNLIENRENNEFFLCEVTEAIGKESGSAERMRRLRARNNVTTINDVTHSDVTLLQDVQTSDTDIEKEREKDKERDKDIREDKDIQKNVTKIPYNNIVELFNSTCSSLPSVKNLSDTRKKLIKSKYGQLGFLGIKELFEKVEASDFLTGRSGQFTASFDWILKDSNTIKILEGNYINRGKGDYNASRTRNNQSNNSTNFDELAEQNNDAYRSTV